MSDLLDCQDLRVTLGGRGVLDGFGLRLAAREMVALIGPNGAGKTSALRALARLLPVDRGTIVYQGARIEHLPPHKLGGRIGYLPQGQTVHWPLKARNLVMLGRRPHLSPWQRPGPADVAAVERAMAMADAGDFAERPVTELSGGERARVLLARLLAGEAPLLLVDEPVQALDPYHQLLVMEGLAAAAAAGAGVIVVLHDLGLATRFCRRLILLDHGRVVADGDPEAVLSDDHLARVYGVRRDGEGFSRL